MKEFVQVNHVHEIPDEPFYALLIETSHYQNSYEPFEAGTTYHHWSIEVFPNEEEWRKAVIYEVTQLKNLRQFKAVKIYPARVASTVVVSIDEIKRMGKTGDRYGDFPG